MANPTIRGHQGSFKIFENGALINILHLTSVDVNQESNFISSNYVGEAVPEMDQSIEGWSGTVEMEVKNAEADVFMDALINNNLNGIGVSDYAFMTTENYPDGTTKSYVYFDCVWKLSRRQSGMGEKVTKRLEFRAAGREAL